MAIYSIPMAFLYNSTATTNWWTDSGTVTTLENSTTSSTSLLYNNAMEYYRTYSQVPQIFVYPSSSGLTYSIDSETTGSTYYVPGCVYGLSKAYVFKERVKYNLAVPQVGKRSITSKGSLKENEQRALLNRNSENT